jgi:hypothetical protein
VEGGLLPPIDICPIMTMMMQMSDASVNSIGVRIHANRPTLPIFAVAVVVVVETSSENDRESLQQRLGRLVVNVENESL